MGLWQGNFASQSVGFETQVTIVIPSDIKEDENIKTLFLLHGYSGAHLDWLRYTTIEKMANLKRIAVVMPAINNSFYANMEYGANYFDYLTIELPKIVESTFNLKLTKENTYIAGLSMGGYGALKAALTYPEKYQGAASLSGLLNVKESFDLFKDRFKIVSGVFGSKEKLLSKNNPNDLYNLIQNYKNDLDLYIACGTEDFLFNQNEEFHKYLEKNNFKHIYKTISGDHNWDFWNSEIKGVLDYFFK